MSSPQIVSIQVGAARNIEVPQLDGSSKWMKTAIIKEPVTGPIEVTELGLAGDVQVNRRHHGGIDKAVLAYAAAHYPSWRKISELATATWGGFGENLTVAGLDESSVCLGDEWRAGTVVFQISQPRQPCTTLSRRWRLNTLSDQVIANGHSGWYLRVRQTGTLDGNEELELIARPHPEWTIARTSRLLYHEKNDFAAARELANLEVLSLAWRELFLERLEKHGAS